MTPEEQRIAIAEACGWITAKNGTEGFAPRDRKINILCDIYDPLPQYLNDLNAMHEAENVLIDLPLPTFAEAAYIGWLNFLLCGKAQPDMNIAKTFALAHATAAQRAEAFLRTLNLWKP
jgi:hypothetical protein